MGSVFLSRARRKENPRKSRATNDARSIEISYEITSGWVVWRKVASFEQQFSGVNQREGPIISHFMISALLLKIV